MKLIAENRTKYNEDMFVDLQKHEWMKNKKKTKILCHFLMVLYFGMGIFSLIVKQWVFAFFFFAAGGVMLFFIKRGYNRIAKTAFKQIALSLPNNGYHYLFYQEYVEMRGKDDALIKKIPYESITKTYQSGKNLYFFMEESFFIINIDGFENGSLENVMKIAQIYSFFC